MHTCQQFELYSAEGSVDVGSSIDPAHLQSYLDGLRETPWWERNFPQVRRIEGYTRRSDKDGSCGGWFESQGAGRIEMAPCHMNELFVLHEISHVLAAARFGSHAHDPWFARIYLEAVYVYMGSGPYAALERAFRARGIDADTAAFLNPAGRAV